MARCFPITPPICPPIPLRWFPPTPLRWFLLMSHRGYQLRSLQSIAAPRRPQLLWRGSSDGPKTKQTEYQTASIKLVWKSGRISIFTSSLFEGRKKKEKRKGKRRQEKKKRGMTRSDRDRQVFNVQCKIRSAKIGLLMERERHDNNILVIWKHFYYGIYNGVNCKRR